MVLHLKPLHIRFHPAAPVLGLLSFPPLEALRAEVLVYVLRPRPLRQPMPAVLDGVKDGFCSAIAVL